MTRLIRVLRSILISAAGAAPLVIAAPSFRDYIAAHPALDALYPAIVALVVELYKQFVEKPAPAPPTSPPAA